jgi:hypothetical protein
MYISACLINVIFTLLIIYCLFNSVLTPSNVVTYMKGVEKLRGRGTNFTKWKSELMLIFAIMDRDNSFHEDKLVPISEGDNDATIVHRMAEYEKAKALWKRSDRLTLMIMDCSINRV